MGDGVQRKFAIIINGDTAPRHLANVERAIGTLRAEGEYRIGVASARRPRAAVDQYVADDGAQIDRLISGIRSDDDDLIVVYTTGHGNQNADGTGCTQLSTECLPFSRLSEQLDRLNYGRRILVMDNCFSGNSFALFANSRTTVVTQGSPGETVECARFSPYFWDASVPDADGNGVVTLQERYAHTLREGNTEATTQFFEGGLPVGFSGRSVNNAPFAAEVVDVHDGTGLEEQLARLQPGQLALVTFSADWCGPCQAYKPTFDRIAQELGGRFLMIRAEGREGSEKDWDKYKISAYPTVAYVDHQRHVFEVPNRDHPTELLFNNTFAIPDEILQARRAAINPENSREVILNGLQFASVELGARLRELLPDLLRLLPLHDDGIQREVAINLAAIAKESPSLVLDLKRGLRQAPIMRGVAIALGEISRENPELEAWLSQRLSDADPAYRLGSAMAMGMGTINYSNPSPTLHSLLERMEHESNPSVRIGLLESLAILGQAAGGIAPAWLGVTSEHGSLARRVSAILRERIYAQTPALQLATLRALPWFAEENVSDDLEIFRSYLRHPDTHFKVAALEGLARRVSWYQESVAQEYLQTLKELDQAANGTPGADQSLLRNPDVDERFSVSWAFQSPWISGGIRDMLATQSLAAFPAIMTELEDKSSGLQFQRILTNALWDRDPESLARTAEDFSEFREMLLEALGQPYVSAGNTGDILDAVKILINRRPGVFSYEDVLGFARRLEDSTGAVGLMARDVMLAFAVSHPRYYRRALSDTSLSIRVHQELSTIWQNSRP